MVRARVLVGRLALVATVSTAASLGAGCDAILGIPAREQVVGLSCSNDGTCVCAAGRGDCDGDPSNGCEAAFDTDADHCGACGHGCEGGTCKAGVCQPVKLLDIGGYNSLGLAVDDKDVFWIDCSKEPLKRMPQSGGKATGFPGTSVCDPVFVFGLANGISRLGDALYWTNTLSVFTVAMKDPAKQSTVFDNVLTNLEQATLSVAPGVIYVLSVLDTANQLDRYPIGGGTPQTLLTAPIIGGVTTNSKYVFWSGDAGIYRATHSSTQATLILPDSYSSNMAADERYIYWVEPNAIRRAPVDGGEVVKLAHVSEGCALSSDGEYVYWMDENRGTVGATAVDGSGPQLTLASGMQLDACSGIVANKNVLFWGTDRAVYKVSR